MTEAALIGGGLVVATIIGSWLYIRYGGGSSRISGVFGVLRGAFYILAGILAMAGGPMSFVFGTIFVAGVLFLTLGHLDRTVDSDVRGKLAGVQEDTTDGVQRTTDG
jgi:hypothetical protein